MFAPIKTAFEEANIPYWEGVPLSLFTSLHIGGKADFLVVVYKTDQLVLITKMLRENGIPFVVLGAGQNIVFSDQGFNGVVIKNETCDQILLETFNENYLLQVPSGYPFASICSSSALEHNLEGLEWGIYIPGTVGGAIINNVDSYNSCLSNSIHSVQIISNKGEIKWVEASCISFGKRQSLYLEKPWETILSVKFELRPTQEGVLKERIEGFKKGWKPEVPNAGAIFRTSDGSSVAKLLDELGLRGKRIGDALISYQNPAWFVNVGNSTAKDYIMLMNIAYKEILSNYSVRLIPQIKFVGEFSQEDISFLYG